MCCSVLFIEILFTNQYKMMMFSIDINKKEELRSIYIALFVQNSYKIFFVLIDKLWPILGFRATLLVAKIYMELFPSSSRRTLPSHAGNKLTMPQQSSDRCRKWLLAAAAQVALPMQMHSPNNSCPQVGNTLTTIPNHLFKRYLKFYFS